MPASPPPNPLAAFRPSGSHAQDETDVRNLVGAWLRSHEGLRSSGPTEGAYEALILPTDEPEWRRRYADEAFSCALRYRAALYHLGVRHPLVACPYRERVGRAVSDLAEVARAYGAIVEGPSALGRFEPREGDALCSLGRAGPHVSCVTLARWLPGAGLELECADGGQGRKGSMAVDRNVYLHTGLALRSVEEPHSHASPGNGLPIVWAIDLWRLLLGAGVLADRLPRKSPAKSGAWARLGNPHSGGDQAPPNAARSPTRAPKSAPTSRRLTGHAVVDGLPAPVLKRERPALAGVAFAVLLAHEHEPWPATPNNSGRKPCPIRSTSRRWNRS